MGQGTITGFYGQGNWLFLLIDRTGRWGEARIAHCPIRRIRQIVLLWRGRRTRVRRARGAL